MKFSNRPCCRDAECLAYTTEFSWEGAKYAEAKSEDLPLSVFCGPQGIGFGKGTLHSALCFLCLYIYLVQAFLFYGGIL